MVAAMAVILLVLQLGLDRVGCHGAGNTTQDLAQLAVAQLAAHEGTTSAAYG